MSFDYPVLNGDAVSLVTLAAAAAGTTNSADQTNWHCRGLKVTLDITAVTGTSVTVQLLVQGKDATSGKYVTLLDSTAVSTTVAATRVYTVYPGIGTTANVAVSDILPKTWRVSVVVAGTTPAVTATVGASVIT